MASYDFVLKDERKFPNGTAVSLYPVGNFLTPDKLRNPSGTPPGSASANSPQTVTNGAATFTATPEGDYIAYASVSGQDRYETVPVHYPSGRYSQGSRARGDTGPNGSPVIDSFERKADESAPLYEPPWIYPDGVNQHTGLRITNGQATLPVGTVGADGQLFKTAFPTSRCEVWWKYAAIPAPGGGAPQQYFDLPGGYELELGVGANPVTWNVYDNVVSSTYTPVSGPTISAGDCAALSFDGVHLKALYKPGNGPWQTILDYTTTGNNIQQPTAGKNGGVLIDVNTKLEELGGGSF